MIETPVSLDGGRLTMPRATYRNPAKRDAYIVERLPAIMQHVGRPGIVYTVMHYEITDAQETADRRQVVSLSIYCLATDPRSLPIL